MLYYATSQKKFKKTVFLTFLYDRKTFFRVTFISAHEPIKVPQRASVRAYTIKSYFSVISISFVSLQFNIPYVQREPFKSKKLLGRVNLIFTVASLHAL